MALVKLTSIVDDTYILHWPQKLICRPTRVCMISHLVLITSSIAFYLHFFYYRCAWQRCKIIDNWKERYQILMLKCRGLTVVSRHKPLITSRTYHETKFLSQNIVENFAHKLQHCKKYLKLDIAVQKTLNYLLTLSTVQYIYLPHLYS